MELKESVIIVVIKHTKESINQDQKKIKINLIILWNHLYKESLLVLLSYQGVKKFKKFKNPFCIE